MNMIKEEKKNKGKLRVAARDYNWLVDCSSGIIKSRVMIIIWQTNFGGMNKKQPKDNKQNNLNKYLTKNKKSEDKTSPPATAKAEGKKKICHSLNQFLHPQ